MSVKEVSVFVKCLQALLRKKKPNMFSVTYVQVSFFFFRWAALMVCTTHWDLCWPLLSPSRPRWERSRSLSTTAGGLCMRRTRDVWCRWNIHTPPPLCIGPAPRFCAPARESHEIFLTRPEISSRVGNLLPTLDDISALTYAPDPSWWLPAARSQPPLGRRSRLQTDCPRCTGCSSAWTPAAPCGGWGRSCRTLAPADPWLQRSGQLCE